MAAARRLQYPLAGMANRPRLDSWKEIAAYLGRDIRTVIRWEERRRLPVHRLPGGQRPRVFAYPDEIDRWLEQRSDADKAQDAVAGTPNVSGVPQLTVENKPYVRRMALGGLGLVLVVIAALSVLARPAGPPRQLTIAGKELLALDRSGASVWRYPFDAAGFGDPPNPWYHIGDFDADGREETLASLEVRPPGASNQQHGELVAFNGDGSRRWSIVPDDRIAFREGVYGPPWTPADLRTYRVGREVRFAWAVHHFTWWPGLLITLNAQGQRLGTFVNSGWIHKAWPSPDSRHLFIAGASNSRQAYVIGVLDAANPSGRSPELPAGPTECVSCPDGQPLQYLVFPRTDVSREQLFPEHYPTVITFDDGTVEVHVMESAAPAIASTIYELAPAEGTLGAERPPYELREARFSDSYWNWHRRLEAEGRLNHAAADCPERRGLDVEDWTPGRGWTRRRVTVR